MQTMDLNGKEASKYVLIAAQFLLLCVLGFYITLFQTTCVETVWWDISLIIIIEGLIIIICSIFLLIIIKCLELSEVSVKRCRNVVLLITIVMALSLFYALMAVYQACSNSEPQSLWPMIIIIGVGMLCVPICSIFLFCC